MAILEDENRTLQRRVRELEAALYHLHTAHEHLVAENTQLKERVNALRRLLEPEGMLEERKSPRVATSVRIDSLNRRGNTAMGIAKDMSSGGAFIETDLALFPGELITVVFELDTQPFKIPAEVIRTASNGYGIKFVLDPYQRQALEVYVLRLE
jgi:hypothetical protein